MNKKLLLGITLIGLGHVTVTHTFWRTTANKFRTLATQLCVRPMQSLVRMVRTSPQVGSCKRFAQQEYARVRQVPQHAWLSAGLYCGALYAASTPNRDKQVKRPLSFDQQQVLAEVKDSYVAQINAKGEQVTQDFFKKMRITPEEFKKFNVSAYAQQENAKAESRVREELKNLVPIPCGVIRNIMEATVRSQGINPENVPLVYDKSLVLMGVTFVGHEILGIAVNPQWAASATTEVIIWATLHELAHVQCAGRAKQGWDMGRFLRKCAEQRHAKNPHRLALDNYKKDVKDHNHLVEQEADILAGLAAPHCITQQALDEQFFQSTWKLIIDGVAHELEGNSHPSHAKRKAYLTELRQKIESGYRCKEAFWQLTNNPS